MDTIMKYAVAYETLRDIHNALVHQLQKLTISTENIDWTLIGVCERKQISVVSREEDNLQHHTQVDALCLKSKRSDGDLSSLGLETKEFERASSKGDSYIQGCKVSITPVQERKGNSQSQTEEDRREPQDQGFRSRLKK